MRIAFVVNNYPPRLGGLESHVSSLARNLARLGHEIFVYTLSDEVAQPERTIEFGITVTRYPEYFQVGDVLGFARLGTSKKLRRAMKSDRIEVVSVHTRFFTFTWIGALAAKRLSLPLIHTEHGSGFVVSNSKLISLASRFVDLSFGRLALRAADVILGVSENVLEFVNRLSGRRGELFYNAIEPEDGPLPNASESRPEHLVFVGRLVPGKGWDTFIDAVESLTASGFKISAEVLGDGPDRAALAARIARLAQPASVVARGRVSPEEVREALRGATLVNPTVLSEGFQTTLLEALAVGGSVVTYPVPGAASLADAGGPVRVTSSATLDSLLQSLRDSQSDPLPPVAEDFMGKWTWPQRAQQFIEVCERLRIQRTR